MNALWAALAALSVGFLQVFFVSSQTLSLSRGERGRRIFLQSLAISGVWSLGVLAVSRNGWMAVPYTIGAACGATTAAWRGGRVGAETKPKRKGRKR